MWHTSATPLLALGVRSSGSAGDIDAHEPFAF
jgi:hypothetical protein